MLAKRWADVLDQITDLIPIFGSSNKPLALLTCDDVHHGPLRHGTRCCCAVCHQSGRERQASRQGLPVDYAQNKEYIKEYGLGAQTSYVPGALRGGR